jgi:uncharacterized protein
MDLQFSIPALTLHADPPVLLLAHGAGAGMDSPFMNAVTALIVTRGIAVARFEFQYMALRREDGRRRPPPKINVLLDEYRAAAIAVRARFPQAPLHLGGKSMGGRVASMIADELFARREISGCVGLGYPFHPAGKPEALRTGHLLAMTCPTVIVQGERDALGDRREVGQMRLSSAIQLNWIGDGDHDLRPRIRSGFTNEENLATAADAVAAFVKSRRAGSSRA